MALIVRARPEDHVHAQLEPIVASFELFPQGGGTPFCTSCVPHSEARYHRSTMRVRRSRVGSGGGPGVLVAVMGAVLAVSMLAVGCGGTGKTASSGSAGSPSDSVFAGAELSPARPAPAFALHDQQGSLVQLAAQRGRLVVVTFLYTRCRDVCPLIANNLNSVLHRLGPDAGQLRVLAVSVDPKGDTPAAVRRYARQHALLPQFHYLIGTRRELAPVWRSYHVAVSGGGGQVNHSAYTVLIDREGKQRVLYASDFRPAEVLRDVRRLLGRQA